MSSVFDTAVFDGADTYDGILPSVVRGGVVTIGRECYRATRDNVLLDDIGGMVLKGEVTVDVDAEIPMSFKADVRDPQLLEPYQDWVAPFLTVTRPSNDGSGDVVTREQVGLFVVLPSKRSYTALGVAAMIDARDATWVLASDCVGAPYTVTAGTNYSAAVRTLIESAGLTRHAIQSTAATLRKTRTWKAGTSKLTIVNDLLTANGFYPAWADRVGRIRSRRFQQLKNLEPARTFASAAGDVLGTADLEPDLSRLVNKVVVVRNDPTAPPIVATRINNDPESPTSTASLDVTISRTIEDPGLEDQDAADALADRIMEQSTSVFVRLTVTTPPDPVFSLHDTIQCDIVNDAGDAVAAGEWRWDHLTLKFDVDVRPMTWRLNRLLRWQLVSG